jgi:transcriptional regulator of arginine metabolism
MKKLNKVERRHEAIKELIKTQPIEDQQTLVQLIKDRYGIDTNQSIVSRDLRAIGVGKHKSGERMIYEVPESDASKEILRLAVVSIEHNETLIVIRTLPGLASFVGDYLDLQEKESMLATLAGENVVFVAPKSTARIQELFNQINELLYIRQSQETSE